jgi:uncharacterized membrane protein YbjE (DUF340 family)
LSGLFGGFVASYSHTLRETWMERATRLGQEERGFPLLRFLTVVGTPIGGTLAAFVARLLGFPTEVALALIWFYGWGSVVSVGFLISFEVVVKKALEDEEP